MKTKILTAVVLLVVFTSYSFRVTDKRSVKRHHRSTEPNGIVYIIVDKSDYELQVYDEEGWYATYPVVFGNKDLSDKMVEGDKKTPEGNFKIISKKAHNKWHKMFMLDFPTKDSWTKFNQRKANGQIPKSAKIGGGIAIHGTWPNDNIVVDDYTNWTQGCVSLKNEDLDEIDRFTKVGTKVMIRR